MKINRLLVSFMTLSSMVLAAPAVSGQDLDPAALAALAELRHKPEITDNPDVGRWYRITPEGAVCSDGAQWHGLFRKGTENKVLIDFYGGGVSLNDYTDSRGSEFFTVNSEEADGIETFLEVSSDSPANPFKDWTKIVIPYASGDFHAGTGDNEYDVDGKRGLVRHHGWTNFQLLMETAMMFVGSPDAVVVTGFSAGGFATALLTNDILTDYFPEVKNTAAFVDAALLVSDCWKETAVNVWKAPERIVNRFRTADFVYDHLEALSKDHPDTRILYTCSTRDGALTQYQNYLDNGVFGSSDAMGDVFQQNLKAFVDKLTKLPNTGVFIWDGYPYSSESDAGFTPGQQTTLTQHTLMFGFASFKFFDEGISVADWVGDALNGKLRNLGQELLEGESIGTVKQPALAANPELPANPETMAWYRITPEGTVSSDGSPWWGFFQKGTENKVLIEFYGGGGCFDDYAAFHDMYFPKVEGWDGAEKIFEATNASESNPFRNWTKIVIPYGTGDFHMGTGDHTYTFEGQTKTVHHHGYTNMRALLDIAMKYAGSPEAVVITGFSAGGFGTSQLSNDILTAYFPTVRNTTVLVDAAVLLDKDWKKVAKYQWQAPETITGRLKSKDLAHDALKALSKDHPSTKILFCCATKDSELAKNQNYLDTGKLELTSEATAAFKKNLRKFVRKFKRLPHSAAYVYEETAHTVLMFGFTSRKTGKDNLSVADWTADAVNGKVRNYGLELLGLK